MVNYNPNRLGVRRRNRRDYSLHQRLAGKGSSDRLNERKFIKLGMQLIIISDSIRGLDNANINNDLINDQANVLLFYGLYYVMKYIHINRPCLVIPIPIYHPISYSYIIALTVFDSLHSQIMYIRLSLDLLVPRSSY